MKIHYGVIVGWRVCSTDPPEEEEECDPLCGCKGVDDELPWTFLQSEVTCKRCLRMLKAHP